MIVKGGLSRGIVRRGRGLERVTEVNMTEIHYLLHENSILKSTKIVLKGRYRREIRTGGVW
jgi:hypothetical protein